MRVHCCGVRGSTPTPGAAFVQTGGHTSCLAVTSAGHESPSLVLDAGTGIRSVSGLLGGGPFRGTILLSHLHWDHVQGLPFFAAADRPDAVVRLLVPARPGDDEPAAALLGRAMSPPHFPIGPEGLRGSWTFERVVPGENEIEGMVVTAGVVPHKGGTTFGYRIDDGGRTLAYVPDHLPEHLPADPPDESTADPPDESTGPDPAPRPRPTARADGALALIAGVDVLVHDAQFVAGEDEVARRFGHATVEQAIALAVRAGVGRLVLFHHAPARTDEEMDRIAARYESAGSAGDRLRISVAREGDELVVGDHAPSAARR